MSRAFLLPQRWVSIADSSNSLHFETAPLVAQFLFVAMSFLDKDSRLLANCPHSSGGVMKNPVTVLLATSITLFVIALPLESFCVSGNCSDWPSWGVLAFGALGMGASTANCAWVANPLLLMAWFAIFRRSALLAILPGVAALIAAVAFLFAKTVITNEAGLPFPVTGYRAGYWFWLASMVMSCVAALWLLIKKPQR
jgi:hypothetical protein